MGKKKKMTAAQAASARYEKTEESLKREKAKERSKLIKQSAENAQKKANKSAGFRMVMPFLIFAIIVLFALVFTIGPGLMMGS